MDFRVTHFLSGEGFHNGNVMPILGENAVSMAYTVAIDPTVNLSLNDGTASSASALQILQVLDYTDPIQKEMRFIKSGKIGKNKAISIKSMTMSNSENPMVKFLGAEVTGLNEWADYYDEVGSGNVVQKCSTLNLVCGQEFSLTVRAQSAHANTISPFGLTKTYTRMVNCCADCNITTFESAYNTVVQVLKDLRDDKVMSAYVVPAAIYGWYNDGTENQSFYTDAYSDNWSSQEFNYSPGSTEVLGEDFAIGIVLEGVPQPNWKNDADITLFPFRKDAVKIFAQTFVGPMAASNPHNGGTQEPLLVADMCDTGKTHTINFAFPKLTFDELKHIEHQYATYSQKYGQRFQGVKYNVLTMPSFVKDYITYTLFYIEYMPSIDVSYTSTMDMTQLTIVAVPTGSDADNLADVLTGFTGLTIETL